MITFFQAVSNGRVCSELWSTPLAWCVTLIKEIGPNGETYEQDGKEKENQRIISKDHKDMITLLMKFKAALDDQKTKSDNSLPKFYKHVSLSHFKCVPPLQLNCFPVIRC